MKASKRDIQRSASLSIKADDAEKFLEHGSRGSFDIEITAHSGSSGGGHRKIKWNTGTMPSHDQPEDALIGLMIQENIEQIARVMAEIYRENMPIKEAEGVE